MREYGPAKRVIGNVAAAKSFGSLKLLRVAQGHFLLAGKVVTYISYVVGIRVHVLGLVVEFFFFIMCVSLMSLKNTLFNILDISVFFFKIKILKYVYQTIKYILKMTTCPGFIYFLIQCIR